MRGNANNSVGIDNMTNAAASWLDTRAAGVLAHVSALPGEYGIGNFGSGAREFIDVMAEAGLRYWQICPLGPTGFGDSPYQVFSGRAANPYFIDLGELVRDGLLNEGDLLPLRELPADRVDYGQLYERFWPLAARAYDRFAAERREGVSGLGSLAEFRRRNAAWVEPYADFMALKSQFGGYPWTIWPLEYRTWRPTLRAAMSPGARREAERQVFYQYVVFGQWERLREYARSRGIGVIGDVAIFVALDSADTWQNRPVFRLDPNGQPLVVAGVPPDYFSESGQLWGNPLYDWDYLARTHYAWWLDRLRAAFEMYDVIRLDHFRGFDTYWEIPASAPDARSGVWRKGPGLSFFEKVRQSLPHARIIAEDLGYIGPDVVALRRSAGLPGMKILQFAYGHDANNANLPHFYPPDSVAYTGTHDNNTTRGWLEALPPEYESRIDEYFQLRGERSAWPMIRVLLSTASRLAVVPMQDLLDLPSWATFNRPGTCEGNWQWRFTLPELHRFRTTRTATLQRWIQLYDRVGDRPVVDYSEPPETRNAEHLKS